MWLNKPFVEITKEDVERLVADRMTESEELEFKRELPSKGGPSAWSLGSEKIEAFSRDRLLEEVIAFANAGGGYLILGIEESADEPAQAKEIAPLQRCRHLAEKLHEQADACIEPRIPTLSVIAVRLREDSDDGVIVFHILRSPIAPHRLQSNKESFIRRGSRCVTLTMQEIQNIILTSRRKEVEGLWTATFGDGRVVHNGGVVILDGGMILGGDANFYYDGRYEIASTEVRAEFRVTHYHGDRHTLYGDHQSHFSVIFQGKRNGSTVEGELRRTGFPIARATLTRRANLP
jgi:hypothetical protein